MRIARTLSLSLMRETLLYVLLAFGALSIILLAQNLLRRLDEFFVVGMTTGDLATVLRCLLPIALAYAIPFAFLIGVLMTLRRLAADRELEALRASGIGPVPVLLPFLALGLVASLLSAWISGSVEHHARQQLLELFERLAVRGAIVEAGKFRHTGAHTLFVEDRTRDGALFGVVIYDRTRPERELRIFASQGQMAYDPDARAMKLELEDGEVHVAPRRETPDRYERVRFESFAYEVDLDHLLSRTLHPMRPKQMSGEELRSVLARADQGDRLIELDEKDPVAYALELERRRALPLAALAFAGLGVPIALLSEQRHRQRGLFAAVLAAVAYYATGAGAESLARAGLIPAALAPWIPNGAALVLACGLVLRSRSWIPR